MLSDCFPNAPRINWKDSLIKLMWTKFKGHNAWGNLSTGSLETSVQQEFMGKGPYFVFLSISEIKIIKKKRWWSGSLDMSFLDLIYCRWIIILEFLSLQRNPLTPINPKLQEDAGEIFFTKNERWVKGTIFSHPQADISVKIKIYLSVIKQIKLTFPLLFKQPPLFTNKPYVLGWAWGSLLLSSSLIRDIHTALRQAGKSGEMTLHSLYIGSVR